MSAIDVLPQPFDWIEIPAGEVALVNLWNDNKDVYLKKNQPQTFPVPAFTIAKYPVTNGQFGKFVEMDGYKTKKWWTADGWEAKQYENWTQPRFWQDKQWNGMDYPVVGVSWYEAVAFCHWLSEQSGEKIMLPTEAQWQRAAQGDDGRIYPWGNGWDCDRCNNSVYPCNSNQTTPVRQYEGNSKGDSFFEVVDMAGNVWEWCLNEYYTGQDTLDGANDRLLRGGSWGNNHPDYFRTDVRARYFPDSWSCDGGFRIIRL